MSQEDRGQSIAISLGISAIDVLTCAMISSFVLFLVMAGTTSHGRARRAGTNSTSFVLTLQYDKTESVFNVILVPNSKSPSLHEAPLSLWTDEANKTESFQGSEDKLNGSALQGTWSWNPVPSLGDALLIIEEAVPQAWNVSVSYAHAPLLREANVRIQIDGRCRFTSNFVIEPGQTIHVTDLPNDGACSAQKSLGL
jgi:hypothetical protein